MKIKPPLKIEASLVYLIAISLCSVNILWLLKPMYAKAAPTKEQSKALVSVTGSHSRPNRVMELTPAQNSSAKKGLAQVGLMPRRLAIPRSGRGEASYTNESSPNFDPVRLNEIEEIECLCLCLSPDELKQMIEKSNLKFGLMLIDLNVWQEMGGYSWPLAKA